MYFYVHFLSRRFQSLSGAASEWRKLRVASKAWPARKPPEVRIPKNECLISAVQECARYRPVYRSWYGYRYIMIHIYIMHVIYCYITTSSGQQSQLLIHWSTHLHRRPGKEILMVCQGPGPGFCEWKDEAKQACGMHQNKIFKGVIYGRCAFLGTQHFQEILPT